MALLPFHHAFGLNVSILTAINYGVNVFLNQSLRRMKDDLLLSKPHIVLMVPMFVDVFYKQIMDQIKDCPSFPN